MISPLATVLSSGISLSVFPHLQDRNALAGGVFKQPSHRHLQVFRLFVLGHSLKEIAEMLGLKFKTADKHLQCARERLEFHDRTSALRKAFELRMFTFDEWMKYKV